jgi:ADP-ribosylation factor-like protein 2
LGLDNAGKTTVLRRLSVVKDSSSSNDEPVNLDDIEPTLGFNIQTLEHRGYRINLWDVGGQKSIRAYWRNYFEKTDGVVWVVDSADRARLQLCRDELHQLLRHERLAGATLLIFANKQDVPGACTSREIERILMQTDNTNGNNDYQDVNAESTYASGAGAEQSRDDNQLFRNRHWSILPCSAATGEGLMDGIDWLVTDIGSRIFLLA